MTRNRFPSRGLLALFVFPLVLPACGDGATAAKESAGKIPPPGHAQKSAYEAKVDALRPSTTKGSANR